MERRQAELKMQDSQPTYNWSNTQYLRSLNAMEISVSPRRTVEIYKLSSGLSIGDGLWKAHHYDVHLASHRFAHRCLWRNPVTF